MPPVNGVLPFDLIVMLFPNLALSYWVFVRILLGEVIVEETIRVKVFTVEDFQKVEDYFSMQELLRVSVLYKVT